MSFHFDPITANEKITRVARLLPPSHFRSVQEFLATRTHPNCTCNECGLAFAEATATIFNTIDMMVQMVDEDHPGFSCVLAPMDDREIEAAREIVDERFTTEYTLTHGQFIPKDPLE